MNGISFMLMIGKPVWKPVLDRESTHIRLVLGPFAFWIVFQDMDVWFGERAEKTGRMV